MTQVFARLAIVTGLAAVVLVFVVAQSDGDGEDGGSGWILGLLIVLAPLLCALATNSITRSRLLRPVGSVAVAISGAAAAVHVGIIAEGSAATEWLTAVPAVATPLLLLAAVVRGPDARGPVSDGAQADPAGPFHFDDLQDSAPQPSPGGPPLDVLNPLRAARSHAVKEIAAWVLAAAVLATLGVPIFRLLGWPVVVARLDAEVVAMAPADGGTAVTFEATAGNRQVRWSTVWEDTSHEVGDRRRAVLDDENRIHWSEHAGLAGMPLLFPAILVGMFGAYALRRWWGLVVALVDLRQGSDQPRLAYVAVIDDPAPKTMRPLVPVWEHDPTTGGRLAKPDVVYRADGETSTHLESSASAVEVRRAWIDTGWRPGAKPRWIGVGEGVVVPHRRSFLGRWYVSRVTRSSSVRPPTPLERAAPDYQMQAAQPTPVANPHRLAGMVLWRLALVAVGIGLAILLDEGGDPAQVLGTTMAFWRPYNPTSERPAL